jgi:hypothetical protein
LVVIGAVAVSAVAAGPAVAAKGGNSDNAHACQQGGHQTLVAAEQPQVAFKNAGECASHGAQGGDTSSLVIDNSGTYPCRPPDQALNCWGTLSGSGLESGIPWTVCSEHCAITLSGMVAPGGIIDAVQLFLLCSQQAGAGAQSTTSAHQPISSPFVDPPSSC